ncbi:MAG: hypothetical protein ISR65_00330 [Bacteriovoracaceae bacterium]|nr:hypothetical protein [Bacteriovoracaceae bacterium]
MSYTKFLKFIFLVVIVPLLSVCAHSQSIEKEAECILQEGDLIFQESKSSQSPVIKEVTKSMWTHVGVIFKHNYHWSVYEAVSPVKITPLKKFVSRGKERKFSIKRITQGLTKPQKRALKDEISKFIGLPYDVLFESGDESIYCSELAWKGYMRALKIKIGEFVAFSTLNYKSSKALKLAQRRYGAAKRRFDIERWKKQKVITPVAMYKSTLIKEVLTSNKKADQIMVNKLCE